MLQAPWSEQEPSWSEVQYFFSISLKEEGEGNVGSTNY